VPEPFKAGQKVRLKSNPARIGVLSGERTEMKGIVRWQVHFPDCSEFVHGLALEPVTADGGNPFKAIRECRFVGARQLRGALTYLRLSGRLADLIYSLNTTNTEFYAYQFKPVLNFLDSPARGLLIADEVGLGKTIEAGLIWTELRSREDARRLLVLCPAMLREKWRRELLHRFGIEAEICSASDILARLEETAAGRRESFALIGSLQGLRPPAGWDEDSDEPTAGAAGLAKFLARQEAEEPLADLVIIDEAHYLRNPETQTARLGRLMRPIAESMVMLSATPIQLRSTDLFHLLHLLDPDSFPFESSFQETLEENAPIVHVRDRLIAGPLPRTELRELLVDARAARTFGRSELLQHLIDSLPPEPELETLAGRLALADRLDRINPLSKVVSRTRKRDVHERRVVRRPLAQRATMTPAEERFYLEVTERVRAHCDRLDIAEGFMLTIPQRQMCSSMAAACRAWAHRADDAELEELVYEAFGQETAGRPLVTPLLGELARAARDMGSYDALRREDSKFNLLRKQLAEYWRRFPARKVVLFSFFRATLHYLHERFTEIGMTSVVLTGGMDKDAVLQAFEKPDGPRILLSSEVASEGVDLQFSSLVVNYDLPWNPMRIEQRIGRIDRIGQREEVILIWNLFLEDTLDDRVYTRLFERLRIFEQALGSTEAILGDDIRTMSFELLRHHLTPAEEAQIIEQARVALEQNARLQEELERQASRLVAHGDFLQMKINAARQLNRYVTNEDLYAYVRDFLDEAYPGCQFVGRDGKELLFEVELSSDAKAEFGRFLDAERLQGRSRLALPGGGRRLCQFENRLQRPRSDGEVISQYHPLVRFIGRRLKIDESARQAPVAAVRLHEEHVAGIPGGRYLFAVQRWSFSGERDVERLAFAACRIGSAAELLEPDDAERLVSAAAIRGAEWHNARGVMEEGESLEDLLHDCIAHLDGRHAAFVDDLTRENRDRIRFQLEVLARHERTGESQLRQRIELLRAQGKPRLIPALEGQIRRLRERSRDRRSSLEQKGSTTHEQRLAAAGVIEVF
jgi:superfamily II DNA or RNA helicase